MTRLLEKMVTINGIICTSKTCRQTPTGPDTDTSVLPEARNVLCFSGVAIQNYHGTVILLNKLTVMYVRRKWVFYSTDFQKNQKHKLRG